MRTLLRISIADARSLDELARSTVRSRASLVHEAIADLVSKHRPAPADDAFGLWGKVDGLAYQKRVRRDW